jgi:ankyrin repeat protein
VAVAIKHDISQPLVEYLIKKGANINEKNFNQDSLLHVAIRKSNVDIIEILLKNGIKHNLLDRNGESALHLAARLNSIDICKLLISTYNFDTSILSLKGLNAFQLATNENLKKYLKEFNQKFDNTTFDVQLLLESSKSGDLEVVKVGI